MKTIDCEQRSPEWFDNRLASIGGSGIKKATSKGRGKAESKTRTSYLYQKADEFITRRYIQGFANDDMVLGQMSEPYSLAAYEWNFEVEVTQVGMVKDGDHKHASVDGLVGDDGIIEIKNTNGPNYIRCIDRDEVPAEHSKQIQWCLGITQRRWCDFVHACWIVVDDEIVARYPDLKVWVKRVWRNEELIKDLNAQADKFIKEMYQVVHKIKNLR